MIASNSSASNNNTNSMSGCEAISSNCVIWQGPDLPCVEICHGDTISSVIAALCEQLIECCEEAAINGFDIDVINQTTLDGGPATTLETLIQLIINNIGGDPSTGSEFDCDDVMKCIVNVEECLLDETTYTQMTLGDYLSFLSVLICDILQQLALHSSQMNGNSERITALEGAGEYTTPTRMASCNLAGGAVTGGQTYPIDTLLDALDTDYCSLRNATGEVGDINSAVSAQPAGLNPLSKASWPASYNVTPTNGGESLANAWAVADDLREYATELETRILAIENSCCATNGMYRMLDTTTEFANGADCAAACIAGAPEGEVQPTCYPIWNSTGILFDSNVPAYLESTLKTELTNGQWYVICPGGLTNFVAEYSTTYPYWTGNTTCTDCAE